ncbi:MAG: glycoside hydrolase, partial [Planctomycetota bacterium]|nr:glycoside hydrolase [Planctomycetota bacterium]
RDPGDPLLEPMPDAETLHRLALAKRGLPEDHAGEIPPADRWIGTAKFPPTRPTEGFAANRNIRVNQDSSGQDQNETVFYVSPVDTDNLVGGANDYRTGNVKCGYYASSDGGLTWTDGVLTENTYPFQGDPVTAFCADGSAIYVCLSFTGSFQPHGLFFYESTDGGQSWSGPETILNRVTGFPFADRPWADCDSTGSAFANRAYVTWTDFGFTQTPIMLRHSSNGGNSWSSNVRVSDGNSTQGSMIAIGPDGSVNVVWIDNGNRVGFDRSTNGGASFGTDVFPSTIDTIPGDPVFRRNSNPVIDTDRGAGAHSGNLYVAWPDDRQGDPDILLSRSIDGGTTWSAPLRVNDDPLGTGADQWFPMISVDPKGRVVVAFFDRRRSAGDRPYEIWGAISRDGGVTFDTNFPITDVASDGSLNGFIGDYADMATTADVLMPLWTDLRAGTGESDAYTDRYPNVFDYDEVKNLAFTTKDDLQFDTQDARFGQDIDYDVAGGFVSELRADAGYARAGCTAHVWDAPPFVDVRLPPAGDGYWYLIAANGPDGVGTYGYGEPAGREDIRDALETAPGVCP